MKHLEEKRKKKQQLQTVGIKEVCKDRADDGGSGSDGGAAGEGGEEAPRGKGKDTALTEVREADEQVHSSQQKIKVVINRER